MSDLETQWIVWVEGLHMVNRVELNGEDLSLELVGKPAKEAVSQAGDR